MTPRTPRPKAQNRTSLVQGPSRPSSGSAQSGSTYLRRWKGLALLGVALLAVGLGALWFWPGGDQPVNIILITLESLRPDHLASFSGKRVTSPNLDALAKEAMVYDDCHSVTSWTLSAHASLFTGLYPSAHQTTRPTSKLGSSYTTIAEILSGRGYQSAGIVSGPYLQSQHNLNQGFEYYDDSPSEQTNRLAHGDITNPKMESLLRAFITKGRDKNRPFFLFAYFWDPHYDYIPPAPYNKMFVSPDCEPIDVTRYESSKRVHANITSGQLEYVTSQYDGEIYWTDEHLGRFFDLLKAEGLWDNTVIIVTADHGEEFFEHGKKGHKNNLYVESVQVPLIIKYAKGGPQGADSRLVSLVDIFPTILDLTHTPADPFPHQGRSLLEVSPSPERAIFYELLSLWYYRSTAGPGQTPKLHTKKEQWFAIRQGDDKLIQATGPDQTELYNVRKDPKEQEDVSAQNPARTQELANRLEQWKEQMRAVAATYRAGGKAKLDKKQLERLRSLGYLQ